MQYLLSIFLVVFLMVQSVNAQQELSQNVTNASEPSVLETEKSVALEIKSLDMVDEIPSLLFTYWEHLEIKDARANIGRVVAPDDSNQANAQDVKPPPEERFVHLQGILYKTKSDWTIWINGEMVRPNALPDEALSLDVFKDYIEIKWFDDYTNQILPLRLKPQERFNIDSRIFLPG